MRLTEIFLLEWQNSNLNQALLSVQKELEKQWGSLSDENNIEKVFLQLDKHDSISEYEMFQECLELYSLFTEADVPDMPVTDFVESLSVWNASHEVECLEEQASEITRNITDNLIKKINEIPCKKKLFLMKEVQNCWKVHAVCDLNDYQNGMVTYGDMQVRSLILKNALEKIRILIIADGEQGDCCIEI